MRRKFFNGKVLGVLAVSLVLLIGVGVAEEDRTDAAGQWKYILEDDGATITGYVEEPTGDLVIPSELDGYPVTGIGYMAFEMCIGLTGVVIPDGVKSIGIAAFDYCEALNSVTIPDSVTVIGDSAFYYCFGLSDVTIPDSVASIGDGAFMGCISLTSVTIPDSVTSIGDEAFSDCSRLTGVTIPEHVTGIGMDAFSNCEKLTLSVKAGSYAAQYAKDNGIPYVLAHAAAAETADELLIKQIDEFFTLPKAEILEKLGSDFAVVAAGPEGAMDGYYYEDLGMAFAFYSDSDALELIDCYPSFKIHGVGTGSLFSEILEALGDTEIIETWMELPIYTAFVLRYRLGNADYNFIAFEKDEPVHILWIHQMP